jgi:hypothetical protein
MNLENDQELANTQRKLALLEQRIVTISTDVP